MRKTAFGGRRLGEAYEVLWTMIEDPDCSVVLTLSGAMTIAKMGNGPDEHRLSLVSWASVRDLGARSGRPDLDARRFRMNLELDGCEPFEEHVWEGRLVRVGEAVLRVLGPVPRCVVTTQDPDTGRKDFDTLKRIAEYRPPMPDAGGVPFGMYAEVEHPGSVAVGDPVEPLGGAVAG